MPLSIAQLSQCIARGEQPKYEDFPDEYILQSHDSGSLCWIDWFVVPNSVQHQGHGRAFFKAIEQWIREGEVATTEIRLMAADSGDGPSDEFWEKMGFVHMNPDSDNYEQAHRMHKSLNTETENLPEETPIYCGTNSCEAATCHRCFPRTDCQEHEKCREWAQEQPPIRAKQ
jgi:hypothetical protein